MTDRQCIAIMPGHGGPHNRGTQADGFDEAGFVLGFASELHRKCAGFWCGHHFSLLRHGDYDVSLRLAATLASQVEAELAVVLHVNAYTDAALNGVSTFAMADDEPGRVAGKAILSAFPRELKPMRERPWLVFEDATDWRQAAHAVLRPYYDRNIPSVLVELFFASSPQDCCAADTDSVRARMHLAVMAGIATALDRPCLVM